MRIGTKTVFLILMVLTAAVGAEIPQLISYQGKVMDSGGSSVADGMYTMQFKLYDHVTAGTELWTSGAVNVQVTGGIFSVLLGESPQPAVDLPFNQDYWLSVIFEGASQTPRQRLGSVGYSYMASGIVPGTLVEGSIDTGTYAALTGSNIATTGVNCGILGYSQSINGFGVYGKSWDTTGDSYGVFGEALAPTGVGVCGYASSSTGANSGVFGASISPNGMGVYGHASSTSGLNYGVYGKTDSNGGYAGYFEGNARISGNCRIDGFFETIGSRSEPMIYAENSGSGKAVYAENTATSGSTYGVYGRCSSPSGFAIAGWNVAASGTAYGVMGASQSSSGKGVLGSATASTGTNYGVQGQSYSTNGRGVFGIAWTETGGNYGVVGQSQSTSGIGVYGLANATAGVNYGVFGISNSPSGHGVYSGGPFAASGSLTSVILTSEGPAGLGVHTTAGDWVEDFGDGRLASGKAHIQLDPLFLEAVTIDSNHPMMVFIQLGDQCKGVYVKKSATHFDVIECDNGKSSVSFDYRIVAKRKGAEDRRFEHVEAALSDPYLYPDLGN